MLTLHYTRMKHSMLTRVLFPEKTCFIYIKNYVFNTKHRPITSTKGCLCGEGVHF